MEHFTADKVRSDIVEKLLEVIAKFNAVAKEMNDLASAEQLPKGGLPVKAIIGARRGVGLLETFHHELTGKIIKLKSDPKATARLEKQREWMKKNREKKNAKPGKKPKEK